MTKGETTTQENLLQTLFKLEAENERLHDAIEKIRAEIRNNNIADFIAVQSAIDIIDKYRKETEKCRTNTTNP